MKLNKIWLLSALLVFVLALAACGNGEDTEGEGAEDPGAEEDATEGEEEAGEVDTSDGSEATETPSEITFGAATVGGVWYTLAGAMSDEMNDIFPDSTTAIVEGGSTANILGIGNHTFDVGFTNAEAIAEAHEGTGEFDEVIDNFSTIATMYPNPVQLVVREDSDIYSV